MVNDGLGFVTATVRVVAAIAVIALAWIGFAFEKRATVCGVGWLPTDLPHGVQPIRVGSFWLTDEEGWGVIAPPGELRLSSGVDLSVEWVNRYTLEHGFVVEVALQSGELAYIALERPAGSAIQKRRVTRETLQQRAGVDIESIRWVDVRPESCFFGQVSQLRALLLLGFAVALIFALWPSICQRSSKARRINRERLIRGLARNLLAGSAVFLPVFIIAAHVEPRLRGFRSLASGYPASIMDILEESAFVYIALIVPVLAGTVVHSAVLLLIRPSVSARMRRLTAIVTAPLLPLTLAVPHLAAVAIPGLAVYLLFLWGSTTLATVAYGLSCTTDMGRSPARKKAETMPLAASGRGPDTD